MKPVPTRIGWADFGDYEHFGIRLHEELTGRTTLAQLLVFGVTGKLLPPADTAILDDLACAAHVPDPRVWPPKVARLVASHGHAWAGVVAGLVVLDGEAVGEATIADAAELVERAVAALRAHADLPARSAALRALLGESRVAGFGVQQRATDERVEALRTCLDRRGRAALPAWTAFEALVVEARALGQAPNIFGAAAAALLDLGLDARDAATVACHLLTPQFVAHAADGARARAPELRRLDRDRIVYVGRAARVSDAGER